MQLEAISSQSVRQRFWILQQRNLSRPKDQSALMFRPVYKVKNLKSLNGKINSLFGNFLIGLEYVLKQSGPMTMGASQVCGFVKSDPSRATPNLQFHVQPISTDILGATKMHDFDGITPTIANIRPTSRGEINIASKDTSLPPPNSPPEQFGAAA